MFTKRGSSVLKVIRTVLIYSNKLLYLFYRINCQFVFYNTAVFNVNSSAKVYIIIELIIDFKFWSDIVLVRWFNG